MSGNTRVGSVDDDVLAGRGVFSVSSASTGAAVPNWRNSGPFSLVLLTSVVPVCRRRGRSAPTCT